MSCIESDDLLLTKIIDFTSLIKGNDRFTVFNPCITHYKDDLYLCSYRLYSRYISPDDYILSNKAPYTNPNHPWRSKWGSNMKIDKSKKGKEDLRIDITKFSLLKIFKENNDWKIELVKDYDETFNDILPQDPYKKFVDGISLLNTDGKTIKDPSFWKKYHFLNFQDSRIVQTPVEGMYFLIGNMSVSNTKKIKRKDQDHLYSKTIDYCNRKPKDGYDEYETYSMTNTAGCYIIFISVIQIDPITLKIKEVHEPSVLCPDFAARLEKNWSLYVKNYQNKIMNIVITYQIREINKGVEVFTLDYNTESNKFSDCAHQTLKPKGDKYISNTESKYGIIHERKLSFFNLIEEAFNHKLHISSTTPTISYNHDELISVGHIKFDWQYFSKKEWKDTAIGKFYQGLEKRIKNFHYGLVYLLFFYTLDKKNLRLKRTSMFFLPQPADVSLVFPVGFTRLNNSETYCLSIGNYDNTSEAIFITKDQIEDSLQSIHSLPFVEDMKIEYKGKGEVPKITNEKELIKEIRQYPFFRITGWVDGEINKVIYK